MDAEVIFYLASTVAQTLAALAGFLGAFVLFQRQGLERQIDSFHEMMFRRGLGDEVAFAGLEGDPPKLIAALERVKEGDPKRYESEAVPLLANYRRRLRQRDEWHPPFKRAMILTAPVLLFSLLMIFGAKWLSTCDVLAWGLCVLLIVGSAACAWLYWRVVQLGAAINS
jgi:hypothetical protein